MNTYALLAIKITLTTVVFLVLLFLAILATTLILQDSGQHPDNWKTTGYDYGAGILVAALYIATVIWQIRSALKKKAIQRQ